jgi:hypothetical protein
VNSNSDKFLKLNELIESHLDPLKMTVDLHQQILQSFLLICHEKNLVDDSTGETFYPIPYQEITECIYALDFEFSDELNSVIEGLIEPLKKLLKLDGLSSEEMKSGENKKSVHQLNAYKRFVSHIQLAVCQRNFIANETFQVALQVSNLKKENSDLNVKLNSSIALIERLIGVVEKFEKKLNSAKTDLDSTKSELSRVQEDLKDSREIIINSVNSAQQAIAESTLATETIDIIKKDIEKLQMDTQGALKEAQKAQKDAEESKTQFVTILGIFASIIIALFGGMSLVKAAVELLTNEGSLPVFVFAVSVLLLSFTLLIMLLTSWILALNTKNTRNYNLFKIGMIVSLLSIIGISSLVIIMK